MEYVSNNSLSRIAFRLIILVLVVFIMIYAAELLVPFTWALMISLASMNLVTRIRERSRMPYGLILMFYIVLIIVVFGAIMFFFYIELQGLISQLGQMQDRISVILHDLSVQLQGTGVDLPDHYDPVYFKNLVSQHNDILINVAGGIGMNLWNLLLMLFYVFFLLYYKDSLIHFAERRFKDPVQFEQFRKLVVTTLEISQQYILGMVILGLITAALAYLALILFGIKSAFFFALFFGFLSLIPVFGVPSGTVVIAIFALLTKDSAMTAVYLSIILLIIHVLQDNVLRPMIMGTRMEVNAFAVFFFVILGGFIWGISGMILFIPIAGIIKILLEHSEKGSHYAVFFAELPKKEKKNKTKT